MLRTSFTLAYISSEIFVFFSKLEVKKVTEIFTRMFHEPHNKVLSLRPVDFESLEIHQLPSVNFQKQFKNIIDVFPVLPMSLGLDFIGRNRRE